MSGVVMSFNPFVSLYAHSADRDWECYKKLEDDHVDLENNTDIHEIAWQLMNREPGINAKVMMGGGEKTMRMKVIMFSIVLGFFYLGFQFCVKIDVQTAKRLKDFEMSKRWTIG